MEPTLQQKEEAPAAAPFFLGSLFFRPPALCHDDPIEGPRDVNESSQFDQRLSQHVPIY